jgi:hypothetical protein
MYIEDNFTGSNRGRPWVLSGPTKIQEFGFDPSKMALTEVHNIAEERACALTGVPAAIVGFGSGLEQTKVGATMKELREAAWNDCVVPLLKEYCRQVGHQLLPDFEADPKRLMLQPNTKDVGALQENQDKKSERADRLFRAGIITRARAKQMIGDEFTPADKVYLLPFTVVEVPEGTSLVDAIDDAAGPEDVPPGADAATTKAFRDLQMKASKSAKQRRLIARLQRQQIRQQTWRISSIASARTLARPPAWHLRSRRTGA